MRNCCQMMFSVRCKSPPVGNFTQWLSVAIRPAWPLLVRNVWRHETFDDAQMTPHFNNTRIMHLPNLTGTHKNSQLQEQGKSSPSDNKDDRLSDRPLLTMLMPLLLPQKHKAGG